MILKFQNVIPAFLADNVLLQSDIWGKEQVFLEGEKIIVKAPSGTGKSTLLSYLFGIRNSYSGLIQFDNEELHKINLGRWAEIRRNKISVLFQDLRLFDELSVRENINLKLKLSPSYSINDASEMLAYLGIESLIDKPCKYLSFGQKQRVALVRSLLQPFDWLLMDEPFSHLDDDNAKLSLQLINETTTKSKAGYIITCLGDSQFPLNTHLSFNRVLTLL